MLKFLRDLIIIFSPIILMCLFGELIKLIKKTKINNRKKHLKKLYINKEYDNLVSYTKKDDFEKNITTIEYLDALSSNNKTFFEKVRDLIEKELLIIPDSKPIDNNHKSFYINGYVPKFIYNEIEKLIESDIFDDIYIAKQILSIIKSLYVESKHLEYEPIKDAYDVCEKYINKSNKEVDVLDIYSYNNEGYSILGLTNALDISNSIKSTENYLSTLIENNEKTKKELESLMLENDRLTVDLKQGITQIDNAKNMYLEEMNSIFSTIKSKSNLKIFPYLAGLKSDLETLIIEEAAESLDWGNDKERKKKVIKLRELRQEMKTQLQEAKISYYQLKYLLELFPSLQDLLDEEYEEVKVILPSYDLEDQDPVRNYLSRDEWNNLTVTEKNQLALDRYIESHTKNKWQIGRDYELYIGQKYIGLGYDVDFTGSYMGLEDMGRDLICHKNGEYIIVQCKFWGQNKLIHEKHINQLFGTMTSFAIENKLSSDKVKGCFITNIILSDIAKEFAKRLNIEVKEEVDIEDFPRIKCNIGVDEFGNPTKIYHLPMDLSYDATKIDKEGEFFARTVVEAEAAGFRRSYKWHGSKE